MGLDPDRSRAEVQVLFSKANARCDSIHRGTAEVMRQVWDGMNGRNVGLVTRE